MRGVPIRFWQWPNVLALDAVAVAVVWQSAFAETFSFDYSWVQAVVLGLSVWLAYVGDRWLDVRKRQSVGLLTQRHRFIARHQSAFLLLWGMVLIGDVSLALWGLPWKEFLWGLGLFAACVVYMLGVHASFLGSRLPKELLVAIIFTGGVIVFFLDDSHDAFSCFVVGSVGFGGLCLMNCLMLAFAERSIDREQGYASWVGQRPQVARYVGLLAFGVIGVGITFIVFWGGGLGGAMVLLGILYFVLNRYHRYFTPEFYRCLVDFLLLIPLPLALGSF